MDCFSYFYFEIYKKEYLNLFSIVQGEFWDAVCGKTGL